jgi:hypothetical protein
MTYAELKARHRAERDDYGESLSLRVHRALSWLRRAEDCRDDDGRFIFLWIAFNAAYAQDLPQDYALVESQKVQQFIVKIVGLDTHKHLYNLLWREFAQHIRVLLDNRYVYSAFWKWQRGECTEEAFLRNFTNSHNAAKRALGEGNTENALLIVLDRLYILRNQLVHGGATYSGAVNRAQLKDGAHLMGELVPTLIRIMMDNPNTLWGDAIYPVIR